MEPLTDEEVAALKELAQNFIAMGRVRKIFTTALLWLSGVVAAGLVLWNAASQFWGKH